MNRKILEWWRTYPLFFLVAAAALGSLSHDKVTDVYEAWAQPNPEIHEHEEPFFHLNMNIDGLDYLQWKALGFNPADWMPARIDMARPGQTIYLRRVLSFTNKVEAKVTKVWICEGGLQLEPTKPEPPATRTTVPTVKIFQVTVPEAARGRCTFEVAAIFWKNKNEPEFRVAFPPVPITIVAP